MKASGAETLSAREARRIALAAQGLARPPPTRRPGRQAVERTVAGLGALQLDSVNVLARSHYLPLHARLGDYDRAHLETAAWGRRPGLFEYWGHAASLMPLDLHPYLRWRMRRARDGELWSGLARFARERGDFIAAVEARIRADGPLTGGDFAEGPGRSGWWTWSDGKTALEWLFWAGVITTRTRRGFERVYDLTERVIPRAVLDLPTPSEFEAFRHLIAVAARAMGVATADDLRDYFRLPVAGFAQALDSLREEGALIPVQVEGWNRSAWRVADAAAPPAKSCALLSPFDNLIWRRERTERLFDVRVRLEIYTPEHKRTHGYYVLPFLERDRITARVDLKSDRTASALIVQASHAEAGGPPPDCHRLAQSLSRMARWLGLQRTIVRDSGDLAIPLAGALRALKDE